MEGHGQQKQHSSSPRVVVVTRPTRLEVLLERQGTLGQAAFYQRSRGQSIEPLQAEHERMQSSLDFVLGQLPAEQRRTHVDRSELDRFLFAPDDIVLVVGQDGLVANTAKYLSGQLVAGINPDFELFEGVLCPHHPEVVTELLAWCGGSGEAQFRMEHRSMAQARREDGQQLLALNDIFVGHSSHQSARYRLTSEGREERQSSSGIICSTGTGATGWARSIVLQRGIESQMPGPQERLLAWFVREPWPSVSTGAELNFGFCLDGYPLKVVSEMGSGGVVFADGIETDRLEFLEGQTVEISPAEHTLNLVLPAAEH
ncbi:hypothetical protein KDL29_06100 [bacterium]|nr:hypothetical protein [bacterium]